MKRDFIVFCLGVAMLFSFCAAGIYKISPAILPVLESSFPILILDAGHGGEDGGATTVSGNKESDINLSIVLKMESLCGFLGIQNILTRNSDISIHDADCDTIREKKVSDLKNRVSLIQNTPNAMLISVHQNTFTDSRYKGSQVFYGTGDISAQWGNYTQELLRSTIDTDNRREAKGVPDHVYLFRHIDCPALLIECGFLSNGEEAALLLTDTYQCKIATAIISAYIHQLQMIPIPLGGEQFGES